MFIEKLKKEQIIAIIDRLGLFGENADKAFKHYRCFDKLFEISVGFNQSICVAVNQFNKNGKVYTDRNTKDNDKTFPNIYLLSDFAIEPAQDNLTKKDYENIQRVYRKAMYEIFGEEYLQERSDYNYSNLINRGFGNPKPKSFYSDIYSNEEGTNIKRYHKHQIERAIKEICVESIEESRQK